MPRCARLLAVVVAVVPVAIAPPARADLAFSSDDAGSSDSMPAPRREEQEEETPAPRFLEREVSSFCGGGGEILSPLDEVQSLLDENKPGMARARLGQVLREGLDEWERPRGFAMAGEIALRIGSPTRAVAWYRDALRVSEDAPEPSARLGLAIALLRSGRRADASSTVRSLLAEECAEGEGGGDPMTCYGAHLVAGLSTPAPDARARELERAREVREESPEYDEMFVDFHRLLPGVAGAVMRTASRD